MHFGSFSSGRTRSIKGTLSRPTDPAGIDWSWVFDRFSKPIQAPCWLALEVLENRGAFADVYALIEYVS